MDNFFILKESNIIYLNVDYDLGFLPQMLMY